MWQAIMEIGAIWQEKGMIQEPTDILISKNKDKLMIQKTNI
jgi:hypothetical protein